MNQQEHINYLWQSRTQYQQNLYQLLGQQANYAAGEVPLRLLNQIAAVKQHLRGNTIALRKFGIEVDDSLLKMQPPPTMQTAAPTPPPQNNTTVGRDHIHIDVGQGTIIGDPTINVNQHATPTQEPINHSVKRTRVQPLRIGPMHVHIMGLIVFGICMMGIGFLGSLYNLLSALQGIGSGNWLTQSPFGLQPFFMLLLILLGLLTFPYGVWLHRFRFLRIGWLRRNLEAGLSGKVYLTQITGTCPRCQGKLTLTELEKDGGNKSTVICYRNPGQHQWEFDLTELPALA